jgi:hypothetical protein
LKCLSVSCLDANWCSIHPHQELPGGSSETSKMVPKETSHPFFSLAIQVHITLSSLSSPLL